MGHREKEVHDAVNQRHGWWHENPLQICSCLHILCPGWHQPRDAVVHRSSQSIFSLIYTCFALSWMRQTHRTVLRPWLLRVNSDYNLSPHLSSGVMVSTDESRAPDDVMDFQIQVKLVRFHSHLYLPSRARPARGPQRGVLKDHHASAMYPCAITMYCIAAWRGHT